METISNSVLTVGVSEHGAELQSIQKNGKEYLWQGDTRFWGRRSPVLFPIVGRVWEDTYRYAGNSYRMGQHGFARDMDFKVTYKGEDGIVYWLESTPETLGKYPFLPFDDWLPAGRQSDYSQMACREPWAVGYVFPNRCSSCL